MPETPDHDPLPPHIRLFAPWTWHWSLKMYFVIAMIGALWATVQIVKLAVTDPVISQTIRQLLLGI
ncbi:MAG: hypothetical protein SH850_04400 [Planctomycetaceae bacterium]|nr:hypothetical protein [Planctomycetaceae bacterium]